MKFGQLLKETLLREYQYQYVDYDKLKKELKNSLNKGSWSEDDESVFLEQLENELDKVYTFQMVKQREVDQRIRQTQEVIEEVVNRVNSGRRPPEDEFLELEAELSDIMATVHDLAKFCELNYTAFYKIVKKHDKHTGWSLRPVFAARLSAKPFFKEQYDLLVVKLSQLYDIVRTRGNPVQGDSAAGGSQQNFVRQTTKYWVHPNNVTELKLYILKHLPVLVFNPNKEFTREDAAITSIYYDTDDLDLYKGRLLKSEGAEAIRLRWYGGMENTTIFVERKTHREDWTGEKSVKARFPLKEKYVNAFMRGDYTVEEAFEKMRKEGKKSLQEIENLERLAREVQYTVLNRKLKPYVRSFYERTAFQLPGDARVRISLDTNLALVREDGPTRAGDNWRRMDIGIDYPFEQLPDSDIDRFPYAILEVKLQTQFGQEPPDWVTNLVNSHLVEAVPKFSKFIQGVSNLFYDRVDLLPYWFMQMDVDIRKPPTHNFGFDHQPSTATSSANSRGIVSRGSTSDGSSTHREGLNDVENEEQYLGDSNRATLTAPENTEQPLLEAFERNNQESFVKTLTKRLQEIKRDFFLETIPKFEAPAPPTVVYEQKWTAPPGKRIHVPVRVEPKTYFALERTYLDYLQYSILIGSVAVALFSYANTKPLLLAATTFSVTALLAILYSTFLYLWRAYHIAKQSAVRYDDRFGPTAVCTMTFIALGVNVFIALRS
ncbi:vacuolar transporter chaperone complex subunit [Schizosaccharomyces japonicus yFS275]|uniref:Vacuolar transporter chaperone complex subunit 4 n=1 Tax=Schizosaccharomyces japonicus (strain yFS275 / FY16936) TaxID=402676 RepID=B6JXF3_SCHJY|nr:vacuolar transporter chaperone complex subunit [Schizosaccharomyces japonicus yFS275]EEB06054.1 vacuolar transporter chaperone complex subunit [Schizosaccharomyces japonicus yFS275]